MESSATQDQPPESRVGLIESTGMADRIVNRQRFQFGLRTLLLAITLLGAYCGAYSVLLQPVVVVEESFHGMVVSGYRAPRFRFGGNPMRAIFAPLIWLDREIRPSFWDRFSDFEDADAP